MRVFFSFFHLGPCGLQTLTCFPTIARVNDDEILFLPEVFSILNPDKIKRDFAANAEDEAELRSTRWCGWRQAPLCPSALAALGLARGASSPAASADAWQLVLFPLLPPFQQSRPLFVPTVDKITIP